MTVRPTDTRRRRPGFTLVELGIVIAIIGIMVTFLLVASYEGVQRANERATEALVLKLDTALADRVDALSSLTAPVSTAHRYLAQVDLPGARFVSSPERAQVIARLDFLRSEMPDVFFVQDDAQYPLNFAGQPWPGGGAPSVYQRYTLPLGVGVNSGVRLDPNTPVQTPWNQLDGQPFPPHGLGIFGASYTIRAGFHKQVAESLEVNPPVGYGGCNPNWYNSQDDDGNGFVDEMAEGVTTAGFDPTAAILTRLRNHRHETARSECLYAVLVEGTGALGSVFTVDDFDPREIGDSDNDGLNEFLDSWGKPLQFFRWPIYFVSDPGTGRSFQKGAAPYTGLTETREQSPLDPNGQLMAPSWWADLRRIGGAQTSRMMSDRAALVHRHLIGLVDPFADETLLTGQYWDRTDFYKRRAFFFKFLILSGGPDLQTGLGRFEVDYSPLSSSLSSPYGYSIYGGGELGGPARVPVRTNRRDAVSLALTCVENQAGRYDPFTRTRNANRGAGPRGGLYQGLTNSPVSGLMSVIWGGDDITNQSLGSSTSGGR